MKKILKMMSVLLALGMLFVGCAQSSGGSSGDDDNNGNDNEKSLLDGKIEIKADDFNGDTDWIIGSWKCTEAKVEITFGEGCPYNAETKKIVKEQTEATYKQILDVQKNTSLNITAENKDGYIKTWKEMLELGKHKYYTNETKTELIQAVIAINEQFKTTVKIVYIYTKQ